MFRLQERHEFEWPVEIRKPVGVDPKGRPRYETHRITCTFLAVPLDEAAGVLHGDDESPSEPLLQRVITGWSGVQDEDGEDLPCTPDTIRRLTKIGYVGAAVTEAYFRALTGRVEKN